MIYYIILQQWNKTLTSLVSKIQLLKKYYSHIYIYIERERERETDRVIFDHLDSHLCNTSVTKTKIA